MTPPSVLLDRPFLAALLHSDDPHHSAVVERFALLVHRYRDGEVRLRVRRDHLDNACAASGVAVSTARAGVLAPVEVIHVAAQYRRAARRLRLPKAWSAALPDPAELEDITVTLVVMRRERLTRIASLTEAFDLLGGPTDEG